VSCATTCWVKDIDVPGGNCFADGRKGLCFSVPNHIQLNLRDINQLFNTIDPSPFPEKDLDRARKILF